MHARSIMVSALLVAAVGLSGCASKEESGNEPTPAPTTGATDTPSSSAADPASGASSSAAEAPNTIEITITGDTVDPSGKRVDVPANEPITLRVTADVPGELHLHSTPEQEVAYEAGTHDYVVTFDRPGAVEVESHELSKVIVQLQVR